MYCVFKNIKSVIGKIIITVLLVTIRLSFLSFALLLIPISSYFIQIDLINLSSIYCSFQLFKFICSVQVFDQDAILNALY